MKKLLIIAIALMALVLLSAQPRTTPRVYVQKLSLENGENPQISWNGTKSAPEYYVKAYIVERPKDVVTTDKSPINTIAVKEIGDNLKFPISVILSVQLGNFKTQWNAGETLRIELKHKKSGQKHSWDLLIPEGTSLIKKMDEPLVVPPFAKKKK